MNLFTYRNVVTGRVFALLAAVSMIMSTLPVSFLLAEASPSVPETTLKLFVVPNPPGDDTDMERMTLSNLGSYDVDVTGWKFVENDGTELPLSGIISGPEDVQLCANDNFAENGGVNCAYEFPAGFNLVNTGGSVELRDENGELILEVSWGDVSGEETISPVTAETSYVVGTVSAETVVVTGGTISAEGGWWFNRDTSNATPIDFNENQAQIGDGSLEVAPLSSEAARKFIGEYYSGREITETKSFSYDFMIGSGGDSSDANEFYLNVYANYGVSDPSKYYDCKYDVVPTTGSTGSFTTVTFDPTQTYPVTTRGDSPYTCPAIPADMDDDSAGSVFRMFALNMGDTTDGDEGLDGYFDNVVNITTSDNDILTTTFDFEPAEPEPERCTVEIVSEAGDYVVENDAGAEELSFVHTAWTAVINGASWIWGDNPVSNPEEDETLTFLKRFGFVGNVISATLEVASDNSNEVELNDTGVAVASDDNNFTLATQDSYDVTTLIEQGNNELAILVNNLGVDGSSARSNPAGLLYKLTIEGEETEVAGCQIRYEEELSTISGYKWSDDDGDGRWGEVENGIGRWMIALRPLEMEPTEEIFVSAESADTVTSVQTLTSGRTYIVEVEGTYSFGNRPDFVADAEWSHRADAYTDSPLAAHGWTLGENTYPSVVGLDLQIDGQNIDWGSFNEDHLYKTIIEGDDQPLEFSIFDSAYGDNEGGLDVAIYDVTDYVTYTELNGYYEFEVSEGGYQIVENMREGWEQIYPAGPSYYHVATDALDEEYNFGNQYIVEDEIEASLVITGPATDGLVLDGTYEFTAEYIDDDEIVDNINWAVREGTCAANTDTVAGNVDGFNNPWSFVGSDFSTTLDMSTWDNGDYCFIVNPSEQSGEEDLRETRWFTLENEIPIACVADVNLLSNASFEEPVVTAARKWDSLAPVSWTVEATSNNALVNMELQRGVFGWLPSDGEQWAELDTDQRVRMKQTIETIPGEEYTLSWDYSARPRTSTPESKMIVKINGTRVAVNNENGGTNTQWMNESYTFTADSNQTVIAFIARGPSNGLGALLDNTSLTCLPVEPEPEVEYGPYCGDGVINQDWEQNEVGDVGYNGTCQQEEQNQCTELKLVKITLEETDSVSFDDTVYLGSASNPIPNGVWFNFNELGDDTINAIATQDNGLAVSRDIVNNKLMLGFRGQNDSRELDQAVGTIETMGIDLGSIDRSPIVGWPLEDGNGNFLDVFDKDASLNTVDFDLRADTGRDAVSIEIGDGEPYNCPIPEEEFRIDGYKWGDTNGNGRWDEDTYLRSISPASPEYGLAGWTIEITNGVDTYSTTTDAEGYYYFDVPEDTWIVSEVAQEGWIQTGLNNWSNYREEQTDAQTCEITVGGDNYEGPVKSIFSLIKKLPRTRSQCDFGNQEDREYVIDGYKWNDENGDGDWDEDESGMSGWTIFADNGDGVIETTTGENGYYSFTVGEGQWEVTEEDRENWTQTYAGNCSYSFGDYMYDDSYEIRSIEFDDSYEDQGCDFGNQSGDDSATSRTGTRFTRGPSSSGPVGQVLGVSTTAGASCGMYLFDYMRQGITNDTAEVRKLQVFLIGQGEYLLPITGIFDDATDQAVRAFQLKYKADVLSPWFVAGLSLDEDPTGYVFKTTRWKINDLVCAGSEAVPVL